jgi:hypothetical protein
VENRNVLIAVGVGAIVLAVVLVIALVPEEKFEEKVVDPYVVQLEKDVGMYTSQIDSLNQVVDGLNGRINTLRADMDSARASNQVLLASLRNVTSEMKEYRRLYTEQRSANDRLVAELRTARQEKEQATEQVRSLKTEVDSLSNELYSKSIRLTRLESRLEEAISQARVAEETVTSVLVLAGSQDDLERMGYLKTWRPAIFSRNYRVVGFPEVLQNDGSGLTRVAMGETLTLNGQVEALCDRHGKLDKGKEYELSEGTGGQSIVTFVDESLKGQRILAVLKNP